MIELSQVCNTTADTTYSPVPTLHLWGLGDDWPTVSPP